MTSGDSLLHRALKWNAGFSAASAILMVLGAGWLAAQLGLPGPVPIYVVAAFLVVFALQLGNIVRTREYRNWEISSIIIGDLAWVAASAVLVAIFFDALTTTGLLIVDAVALIVLIFAIQQIRGLRMLRNTEDVPG